MKTFVFLYLPGESLLASPPPPRLLLTRSAQPARHTGDQPARFPLVLPLPSLAQLLFPRCSGVMSSVHRSAALCWDMSLQHVTTVTWPRRSAPVRNAYGRRPSQRSPFSTPTPPSAPPRAPHAEVKLTFNIYSQYHAFGGRCQPAPPSCLLYKRFGTGIQ